VNTQSLSRRSVGIGALVAIVAATLLSLTSVFASPVHAGHQSSAGDAKGFTGGWYDGRDVEFFYNKDFFCSEPPSSGADSNCELGAEPERAARPGNVPVLYVMTPLGFRPDESTLQCPEIGNCINHPSTIDVSRIFGPGTENFDLPAHSHIVDVDQGGWWEIEVIGVTDPAIWDEIVDGKSLERVRELQADGVGITGDIPSNLFLFFDVID
jgi:hypothetical protein